MVMWQKLYGKFFPDSGAEKGQSLIILVFSFIGLVALLGLGIDAGMVYIEQTSLSRAVDAAALSGVTELNNEEEAALRAIEYLGLNDYDLADSNIYIRGCVSDVNGYFDAAGAFCPSGGCDNDPSQMVNVPDNAPKDWWYPYRITDPNDANVTNVFQIDTYSYQSDHASACNPAVGVLGEANKIGITGTVKVDMNFFQLLGRPSVDVVYHAVAQNLDSIDAAIVLDRSGSMEFDPVCYGCWERRDRLPPSDPNYLSEASTANDNPRYSRFYDYPANGVIYPLGLSDGFANVNRVRACTTPSYDADQDLPTPTNLYSFNYADTAYTDSNGLHYTVMEAELYSLNPNPADPELQASGKGYWALQRGEGNYRNPNWSDGTPPYYFSTGTSIDSRGAHMAYHPSILGSQGAIYGKYASLADARSGNSPWLEYDFQLYQQAGWTTGTAGYIWIRVHAGRSVDIDTADFRDSPPSDAYWALTTVNNPFDVRTPPTGNAVQQIPQVQDGSSWRWLRMASFTIDTTKNYRLYIFAGSPGYSIDRIVITDNPSSSGNNGSGSALNPPGSLDARIDAVNAASAYRAACDICNVEYGANITDLNQCTFYPTLTLMNKPEDNRTDPIFDEWEMPLRKSKEAIKFFISRLKPERDQVGFVYYSTSGRKKTELACKRAAAAQGINCNNTGIGIPISYTTVLKNVEETTATGGTPTAYGMKDGLEILGFQVAPGNPGNFDTLCDGSPNSSCSRGGGAQKVLILLTDGNPNSTSWGNGCSSSTAPAWPSNNNADYRCPLEYAKKASQAGITVYTIGLGFGVDRDWLKEVARQGNGQAYFSASGGDLNIIFNQILSNIYVRLIQ